MISTTRRRPPGLETVRRRLDRWRQQRRPHARAPLPPRLWAAAVALVPGQRLYGTARALRLDYDALKRHVEATGVHEHGGVRAGFLELPAPPSLHDPWLIEIAGSPTTVRVRLNGLALTDLAEFTRPADSGWGRGMIQLTPQMRILVAIEAQDFRKGIDGLPRVCRDVLEVDAFGGTRRHWTRILSNGA